MDLLVPLLGGALLVTFTGVMTWINKTQFDTLRCEMHRGFGQADRRFEQMDRRFEQIAGELAALRSDLTQVALAVGARRPQTS